MEKTSGVTEIELKGEKYKFCFDMNAMEWYEEETGESFEDMVGRFQEAQEEQKDETKEVKIKIKDITNLVGSGLQINAIDNDQTGYTRAEIKKIISGITPETLGGIIQMGFTELIPQ